MFNKKYFFMFLRYNFWRSKIPLTRGGDRHLYAISKSLIDGCDDALEENISSLLKIYLSLSPPSIVGLSACQIGYPFRLFALKGTNGHIQIFVNPSIISTNGKMLFASREGCLSFPKMYRTRMRWNEIIVETKYFKKSFFGFESFVIQHEIDHLNGIVFY